MWIIQNIETGEEKEFKTIGEWQEFVQENGWEEYSIHYSEATTISKLNTIFNKPIVH